MNAAKRLFLLFLVIAGLGCGDDGGGIVTTSDTDGGTGDPTTTTTTTTTSTTTTSTDTGDPESDGLGPCKPVVSNAGSLTPAEYIEYDVDLAEVCNDDLLDIVGIAQDSPPSGSDILQVGTDDFRVLVYAPDTTTPLPEPLPIVLFAPGNGQFTLDPDGSAELYAHIAEPLVEDGYIAMFIQPPVGNMHSGKRWRMQLCTLVWAATAGPDGWDPPRDGQVRVYT